MGKPLVKEYFGKDGNVRLAEDYLKAASAGSRDPAVYGKIARIIREAPVNIAEYWSGHKRSLVGLPVKGICSSGSNRSKTQETIESLFEDGLAKTTEKSLDRGTDWGEFTMGTKGSGGVWEH